MKRHALLIDSGKADKDKPILGSHLDINNVAEFLMSPLGGAWDRGELDPVSCPPIVKLLEMIDRANGADYVFLFFTGHGGYVGRHMTILLAPNEPILLDSVTERLRPRFTMVVDACGDQFDEVNAIEMAESARLLAEGRDRSAEYRAYFDQCVAGAATDRCVMLGCHRGQSAIGMSKSGGLFTNFLVNGAKSWSSARRGASPRALTCWQAIGNASAAMGVAGHDQTPHLLPISRQADLPFAVWLPR